MKKVKRIVTFLMLVFAMVLASPVKNVVHAETAITINENYFKDSNFRKWLKANADSNKDGKLSSSEISSVDKLSLSETGISTLEGNGAGKGIHLFTNLKELYVSDNNLERLDLTGLTKLETLYCRYNKNLTSINFGGITSLKYLYCNNCNIQSLDLNGLTALIKLNCNGNNNLAELKNLKSSKLAFLDCSYCALTLLDISELPALITLDCSHNRITGDAKTGYIGLSTLTTGEKNNKLQHLYCHNNVLGNLNVTYCTALTDLHCNDNKLIALNVNKNTELKTLWCEYNNIKKLDVRKNKKLNTLRCHSNPNLSKIIFGNNAEITEYSCAATSISYINPADFPKLVTLNCDSTDITSLNVSNNTALEYLYCSGCQIGSLDVRGLSNLRILSCTNCNLSTLELGGNTALDTLYCTLNNNLKTINLDGLVNMTCLRCRYTDIRILDMRNNKPLSDLIGQNNAYGGPCIDAEPDVVYVRYGERHPDEIAAAKEAAARAGVPNATIDNTLHVVIPNWTNYRGSIVAVDNNGRLIRYTGVVTWRGYYLLIANGALYKQPTFFRDKADGKWRYFVNGVQTRNNNTFVSQFGRLWHVNNGVLDTTDCFVRYNGKFVYSYHGMAATSYTGWVQYDQYKCYLVNGVLTKITR